MSKSNSIITDIDHLLMYCDDRFRTRNVSIIECLKAIEADARQFCMSKQQILEQVAAANVAAKVAANAASKAVV